MRLSPGGVATLACLLEVAAPKPGNVHRGADFEDTTFHDFLISAVMLGQTIDQQESDSLGRAIYTAVEVTQQATETNTNLGMVLLILPLAMAYRRRNQVDAKTITAILNDMDREDAKQVYRAIRLAKPGGLGQAQAGDVTRPADDGELELMTAMKMAAHRDWIAKQYAESFADVFQQVVPRLLEGKNWFGNLTEAIVYAHVATMAALPDSLIARKCGEATARHSQMLAQRALDCLERAGRGKLSLDQKEDFWNQVSDLDFWLRSDGHRRNPGTTADLIAAGLFVAIANRDLRAPFR